MLRVTDAPATCGHCGLRIARGDLAGIDRDGLLCESCADDQHPLPDGIGFGHELAS